MLKFSMKYIKYVLKYTKDFLTLLSAWALRSSLTVRQESKEYSYAESLLFQVILQLKCNCES